MADKDTTVFDPLADGAKQDTAVKEQEPKEPAPSKYDGVSFAPQTVVRNAYSVIEDRASTPGEGVKTGIAPVDADFLPMRPGELCGVLGYTSNGKSALMNFIARNHAIKIVQRGDVGKRAVLSVTYEQSIEEQGVIDMAQIAKIDVGKMMRGEIDDAEWRSLRAAGVERGKLPWWLIGHSSLGNARRPHLKMSELWNAIADIIDRQKITIELIALDYLQRIPGEAGFRDRRERFVDIVDRAKDMALAFHCPVLLGCQAGRQVKDRAWQMPQLEDAQETSNFEQSSDKAISVWMPKTTYPTGQVLEYGDRSFTVNDNLLLASILKQKFGPAPRLYDLFIKPEINQIAGMVKYA